MTTIDFSPLFSSTVGYDRVAKMLNANLSAGNASQGYPPYNIEVTEENHYAITLAVAGFAESDLHIQSENGVLTVRGNKMDKEDKERHFLHRGIANRSFERKFNLADHVEVSGAELKDGMLTVHLLKEVPEAMKPRTIHIGANQTRTAEKVEASV